MRFRLSLLSAVSALALGLAPAVGQGIVNAPGGNYEGTNAGGTNTVIVITPRVHAETSPLNAPPENVYMSQPVNYADLDLRTPEGAHELRARVRYAAESVCGRLRDVYPYTLNPHRRCYWQAVDSAMLKADAAISDARWPYNYRYRGYGYESGYYRDRW